MKKSSTLLCFVINSMSAVCITIIAPTLLQLSKDFSLGLSEMGILLTCQFVGFTVFVVASGITADHTGKKNVVSGALIMLAVSALVLSFAPNYPLLCAALFFLGGGMGILETMSNALLADIDPGNSVFMINFLQVFFGLGAILGPILVGTAYSRNISWRLVYQVISVITAAIALWFVINKLPPLPKAEKIHLKDVKALMSDVRFLMICFCMLSYTGAESSGWGWLSTYTETNLGFSVFESSAAVAVFWIAVTVSRLIISLSIKKLNLVKLIMSLAVSAGIVCAAMGIMRRGIFVWIVIVLLGVACSSQWGMILSYGTERYRRNSGTVFAVLLASGGIGMSIVPYLMGFVGDRLGMRVSLAIPALFFMSIAFTFIAIVRLENRGTVLSGRDVFK
ncbi:MAG: MFS transporter [Synergistaceae bacterium]|jgi:fucose permease|nr:MFS transporter [Synergistaceae bacterium]